MFMRFAELVISRMKLFEFDSSASFFEFSFESFSVSFSNAFFNSFRSAVNESFSVFQAEAGNFTDNFDNTDFFVASRLENDVKFGFFFSSSSASSRSSSNGNRSSSGHAKGLLDVLHELGSLEQGHLLQSLNDLFASNSHVSFLSKGPGPSQPNVFVTRRLSGRMS